MKQATSIISAMAASFVILGGVFAATEVRYTPRIVMAQHVLADKQHDLRMISTQIQFQIDTLEDRKERMVRNGESPSKIKKIERRVNRLERQQDEIEKELREMKKSGTV